MVWRGVWRTAASRESRSPASACTHLPQSSHLRRRLSIYIQHQQPAAPPRHSIYIQLVASRRPSHLSASPVTAAGKSQNVDVRLEQPWSWRNGGRIGSWMQSNKIDGATPNACWKEMYCSIKEKQCDAPSKLEGDVCQRSGSDVFSFQIYKLDSLFSFYLSGACPAQVPPEFCAPSF